jgi:hypothetical protein
MATKSMVMDPYYPWVFIVNTTQLVTPKKINSETAISMYTLHAEIVYWSGESTQYCSHQQAKKRQKEQQAWIAPPGDWLKNQL